MKSNFIKWHVFLLACICNRENKEILQNKHNPLKNLENLLPQRTCIKKLISDT